MLGGEVDERVDVAKANIVGAAGHLRDRRGRAVALIDFKIDALGLEVALVLRDEEKSLWSLVFPVEDHLELGFRVGDGDAREHGSEARGGNEGDATDAGETHASVLFWRCEGARR